MLTADNEGFFSIITFRKFYALEGMIEIGEDIYDVIVVTIDGVRVVFDDVRGLVYFDVSGGGDDDVGAIGEGFFG